MPLLGCCCAAAGVPTCSPSASHTDFCSPAAAASWLTVGGPPIRMAPIAALTCEYVNDSHLTREPGQLLVSGSSGSSYRTRTNLAQCTPAPMDVN